MTDPIRIPVTALQGWEAAWLASGADPYLFVTGVLGVLPYGAPNPKDLPQLERWQSEVLQAIRDGHHRISVRSGHGVGKGAVLAWLVLWGTLCFTEIKIPVAANSQKQLKDNNWSEISKWHKHLPEPLRDKIEIQVERVINKAFPEEVFATARTARKENPEALQGIHSKKVVFLVDECSGIDDIIFEAAQGSLSTPGAIIILFSNPTKRQGFFYNTQTKHRALWKCFRVSSEDVPRARHHIDDVIRTFGKDSNRYRVRVLGEFPDKDDDTVISLDLIEAAVGRQVNGFNVWPVWGLDVGRHGDDPSALAKRRGNHLLEPVKEWKNLRGDQVAGRVIGEFNNTDLDLRPRAICVDVIGVGASAYDFLLHANLPGVEVIGINVAEGAPRSELCHRLRDDLWWAGREWFEKLNCFIPDDSGLIAELSTPTYEHTASGKVIVQSKSELPASPNRADAFLLTFGVQDVSKVFGSGETWRRFRPADRSTSMAA